MSTLRTSPRPLPRTLDPREDETLLGLLLRLAYLAGTTPAELAVRLGLVDRSGAKGRVFGVPAGLLVNLDDEVSSRFATVARLTSEAVRGLLLEPLGTRYGPLNRHYAPWASIQQMVRSNPWVFVRTTRYCSKCLEGDGSAVENMLGGAWRRSWRLPPVFACVQHRCLLRDACPRCDQPPGHARFGMLAQGWDGGLHPTQCRAPVGTDAGRSSRRACGADLSTTPRHPLRASDGSSHAELLSLQQRFDRLLHPDGPSTMRSCAISVPVAQYFTDLRIVTSLIFISWPQARPMAATTALAAAIDREASLRHRTARQSRPRPGTMPASGHFLTPPAKTPATGAVLGVAERLLTATDEAEAQAALTPLYRKAVEVHPALSRKLASDPGISSALQRSLGPATRGSGARKLRRQQPMAESARRVS